MTGQGETFTCGNCGGTFVKGWSDEEAAEEYAVNMPGETKDPAEQAYLCDDCYPRLLAWARDEGLIPSGPAE